MDLRDISKVFHPTAEYIVHIEHFLRLSHKSNLSKLKNIKNQTKYIFSNTMVQNLKSIIGETVENSQKHVNLTTHF